MGDEEQAKELQEVEARMAELQRKNARFLALLNLGKKISTSEQVKRAIQAAKAAKLKAEQVASMAAAGKATLTELKQSLSNVREAVDKADALVTTATGQASIQK